MALPMISSKMALFTVFPDISFLFALKLWVREARQEMASENRCKYIPVRLLSAIHGSKHFRKPFPAWSPVTRSESLFGF